jgi:farnesyl diphosphate synthase
MAETPGDLDLERLRRRLHATAILGEACGTTGLIGGQVEDLESEGRAIPPEALERLHRAKTGALLSACVRGGAVLGGASDGDLDGLTRYASAIGLAFQVVDDLLDYEGSTSTLGKTAGKDSRQGKPTYVSTLGLARARSLADELRAEALAALEGLGERGTRLAQLADFIVLRKF